MKHNDVDVMIVGAGPVGLMCSYLASLSGLTSLVVDKSSGPLEAGRADALNARTLQLLEIAGLFDDLYALGKPCNTSTIVAKGEVISRQSKWWDQLEGCFHKHFLMLGQSHIERLLDGKLTAQGNPVKRETAVHDITVTADECVTELSSGEKVRSRFVIGADGSRSFVRSRFSIPFNIVRPELTWAVIDGVIETDFPKAPEIVVFQNETSDVAWIPREGEIDRFYVRMDRKEFTQEEAEEKIRKALAPYTFKMKATEWFSQFSVKESVAEKFFVEKRIFLAGDACHIHSVNGGQGLNTGLADAFNLIWKIAAVLKTNAPEDLLKSYESERLPVAQSVVETSGELVRSTKFSDAGTHAEDYLRIVERRAGNITGMGIRYGEEGLIGTRLLDDEVVYEGETVRLYKLLEYGHQTVLIFGDGQLTDRIPARTKVIKGLKSLSGVFQDQVVWVRPDGYICREA